MLATWGKSNLAGGGEADTLDQQMGARADVQLLRTPLPLQVAEDDLFAVRL
jgi:hypothetical protein